MPTLDKPFHDAVHDEGTERHIRGCCLRFVDLVGTGSRSVDHGETAILALVAAVRDKVIAHGKPEQITCQISPKGSHESSGAAERTGGVWRGFTWDMCVRKLVLNSRTHRGGHGRCVMPRGHTTDFT